LFRHSDEADLRLNPQLGLGRGDLRFTSEFGDLLSDEFESASLEKAQKDLSEALAIDRESLSEKQQLAHEAFLAQTRLALTGFEQGLFQVGLQLPVDQLNGAHVTFPEISSGTSLAPFKTEADYEQGLTRLGGFALWLDRAVVNMRRGLSQGHVHPKVVAEKVLAQLDEAVAGPVEKSPLLGPVRRFPASMGEEARRRFSGAYEQVVVERVLPAYERLRRFMRDEYLPKARVERPGLAGMRDGERYYRFLIEAHTTERLDPDELHQLGLTEVARIRSEMERVMREVGFSGTLSQFFEHLKTDQRFKFRSEAQLLDAYHAIEGQVQKRLGALFDKRPASAFEIRSVPSTLAPTASGAYYMLGTVDGSRPGVFYVNTSALESRTSPRLEALFLHEAIPGHHWQGSLSQEDEQLPEFLRFGGNTAYVEGWALYAEQLGPELGLYLDPYQRFGALDLEMFRALRLVVDTGLHQKGWSREQAIAFMREHASISENDLVAEVDRYLVMPAQALAYKVGQLRISALRQRAQQALGPRFDLRAFHDQVLSTGPLPLPLLEKKINRWIAKGSFTMKQVSQLPMVPSLQSSERDFDFLQGVWKVANRRLKRRLEGCTEWDTFESKLEMKKVLRGTGNVEHYHASFDGRPFEGMAVRLFNRTTKLWSIYWMDSSGPTMDEHPVVGSFEKGVGKFYAEDSFQGRPVWVLYQWNATNPAHPVWSQAMSTDQGATWEWNWEMVLTKADP
jgi:uncharacterized protein (DUF885 family)